MNSKIMSQVLCKRSSQFTSAQWEQFMEELENKNLYLCIEGASAAKAFISPEIMIPVAHKNDTLKIYCKEELEQKNLHTEHQFISLMNQA